LAPFLPLCNPHLRFIKDHPAETCIPELLSSIFTAFKVDDDGLVSLLPHASATEIETLTIITEQCINASLKAHAAGEEAAVHVTSEPATQFFLEIDAMDYCKKWYKAVVVEGDVHGDDFVKVHFVGCTLPYNYLASTSSIHQHELPVSRGVQGSPNSTRPFKDLKCLTAFVRAPRAAVLDRTPVNLTVKSNKTTKCLKLPSNLPNQQKIAIHN
jgi:hypothetical protein